MTENVSIVKATQSSDAIADATVEAREAAIAKLTPKQQAFIGEYLVDYNATRAAQRAGYKGSDRNLGIRGFKLLRHPVIGPEIRRLGAATADELGITREYVLHKLRELVERSMDGEDWSPQSAARALELIGKLRGDMIERVQAEVKVLSVQINDVDMEDLR